MPLQFPEQILRKYKVNAESVGKPGIDTVEMIPMEEWFNARTLDEAISSCQEHA